MNEGLAALRSCVGRMSGILKGTVEQIRGVRYK